MVDFEDRMKALNDAEHQRASLLAAKEGRLRAEAERQLRSSGSAFLTYLSKHRIDRWEDAWVRPPTVTWHRKATSFLTGTKSHQKVETGGQKVAVVNIGYRLYLTENGEWVIAAYQHSLGPAKNYIVPPSARHLVITQHFIDSFHCGTTDPDEIIRSSISDHGADPNSIQFWMEAGGQVMNGYNYPGNRGYSVPFDDFLADTLRTWTSQLR